MNILLLNKEIFGEESSRHLNGHFVNLITHPERSTTVLLFWSRVWSGFDGRSSLQCSLLPTKSDTSLQGIATETEVFGHHCQMKSKRAPTFYTLFMFLFRPFTFFPFFPELPKSDIFHHRSIQVTCYLFTPGTISILFAPFFILEMYFCILPFSLSSLTPPLRRGTADAEIKTPSAENTELWNILSFWAWSSSEYSFTLLRILPRTLSFWFLPSKFVRIHFPPTICDKLAGKKVKERQKNYLYHKQRMRD